MDILLALEVGRYNVLLLHSRIIINIYHRYSRLAYVYMKRKTGIRNPMARAMLQNRQSPQTVPPKKGKGVKVNRSKENERAIRESEKE